MTVAPMRPMASKKVKIITWIVRVVALVILIVLFVVSIREFYSAEDPSKVKIDVYVQVRSLVLLTYRLLYV